MYKARQDSRHTEDMVEDPRAAQDDTSAFLCASLKVSHEFYLHMLSDIRILGIAPPLCPIALEGVSARCVYHTIDIKTHPILPRNDSVFQCDPVADKPGGVLAIESKRRAVRASAQHGRALPHDSVILWRFAAPDYILGLPVCIELVRRIARVMSAPI
jgi:hypothetical protein